MSTELPNYCPKHDQRFSEVCLRCSGEWFGSLSRIEQVLVVLVSQPGIPYIGCQKYIEDFRKLKADEKASQVRGEWRL